MTRDTLQGLNSCFYPLTYSCDFQPFSSRGTHKLVTKILQHTRKCIIFAKLKEIIGTIFIDSHQAAIVALAVVIFSFDKLKEKRSVSLTK